MGVEENRNREYQEKCKLHQIRVERSPKFLLWKYRTLQPGEKTTTRNQDKKGWRKNQYVRYLHTTSKRLGLNQSQNRRVEYLIRTLPDLKTLHRQTSWENIIIALCFYTKYYDNPQLGINHFHDYRICQEHEFTLEIYSTIITRLCKHVMTKTPI